MKWFKRFQRDVNDDLEIRLAHETLIDEKEERIVSSIPEVEDATETYYNEDIDGALAKLQELAVKYPDYDVPVVWICGIYNEMGKQNIARKRAEEALKTVKRKSNIYHELSQSYFSMGQMSGDDCFHYLFNLFRSVYAEKDFPPRDVGSQLSTIKFIAENFGRPIDELWNKIYPPNSRWHTLGLNVESQRMHMAIIDALSGPGRIMVMQWIDEIRTEYGKNE